MSETPPPDNFDGESLLKALVEAGVRFVLIGGFAVGLHGVVRATQDLDIVPDPDLGNLTKLASVLRELDARVIGVDTELLPHQPTEPEGLAEGGSFQVATVHGQLDILQSGAAIPTFAQLEENALATELDGVPLRYCSLEDLIAMKRAADRPIDRRDLEQLAIARGEGA